MARYLATDGEAATIRQPPAPVRRRRNLARPVAAPEPPVERVREPSGFRFQGRPGLERGEWPTPGLPIWRTSAVAAHCLGCRETIRMVSAELTTFLDGRQGWRGACPSCTRSVVRLKG